MVRIEPSERGNDVRVKALGHKLGARETQERVGGRCERREGGEVGPHGRELVNK